MPLAFTHADTCKLYFVSASSTYNYLGCHANQLFKDFDSGNLPGAREIQVLLLSTSLSPAFLWPVGLVWVSDIVVFICSEQFKIQELLTYAVGLGEWCVIFLSNHIEFDSVKWSVVLYYYWNGSVVIYRI